jgi:phosphate transport system substrate-binding protein
MRTLLVAILSLCVLALSACSGGHGEGARGASGGTLTIKGSDTMVILAQRWAEAYMRAHEGTTIQVSGGGSGTGIAALLNGTTDIANSSRPIEDSERTRLEQRRGGAVRETRVALDALAVYVHEGSPVQSLTIAQLSDIFRGRVTSWSAVGGPDRPIVLYSRENNSGTYAYFKEHVLDGADFAAAAQTLPGTAAVINAVTRDPNGIGYGGIGYAGGVRTLPIAADGPPIAPTVENATSGAYPLARHLYMYSAGEPSPTAADFLAWVVSPEGQALVEQVGFYPLPRTESE